MRCAANSDGVSVGNSNAGSNAYSFRFEAENMNTVKAEARNKGNAGNTGMPTGKSLNANGDPVNGVDVKLGVAIAKGLGVEVDTVMSGMSATHAAVETLQPV